MKSRTLYLIIALMGFSLIGMVGVQAYWVKQAWEAKEDQFDQNVNEALTKVINQLEEKETLTIVKQHFKVEKANVSPVPGFEKAVPEKLKTVKRKAGKTVPVLPEKVADRNVSQDKKLVFHVLDFPAGERNPIPVRQPLLVDSLRFQRIYRSSTTNSYSIDSLPLRVQHNLDSLIRRISPEERTGMLRFTRGPINGRVPVIDSTMRRPLPRNFRTNFTFITDTLHLRKPAVEVVIKQKLPTRKEQMKVIKRKQQQAEKIMEKMVVELVKKEVPLQKRLRISEVDSLLANQLSGKGITMPYTFLVADNKQNPLLKSKNSGVKFQAEKPFYQVSLFPNDLVRKPENLVLQFPDKQQYVLSSMGTMLGVSSLFTLIIMGTFGITLHFMIRQKKISEIKSDFINNMTHEFKTPIATISLATSAINSPKVLQDEKRISYYTGVIEQENKRMLSQVENVLQMALMDRQELQLNQELISLQDLISSAISKLKLQVENRGGNIIFENEAPFIFLAADKFHLENAVVNLLDNANKYSPETPEIKVNLQKKNAQAIIRISDFGRGMNADELRRIFEKFYRVPTGNLHDVKGFGLGLSYVKNIVQLHHGQIKAKSTPGKGSTFEVILPIA